MAGVMVESYQNPKIARPFTAPAETPLCIVGKKISEQIVRPFTAPAETRLCIPGKKISEQIVRPFPAPAETRLCITGKKIIELDESEEEEDEEKDEDDIFFEKTFLDSGYKIKDDVHEKLKRFFKTWLCYEYGIEAPNKKIPRTHLYITVKRGFEKSEVFGDLEKLFNCTEPAKYFDLRDEPKTTSKLTFCTRPGGVIRAKEVPGPNQAATQDGVESCSSGTLTMFCFERGCHYALTCFHVGCQTENQRFNEEFDATSILNIREKFRGLELQGISKDYYNNTKKYYYRAMQSPVVDHLELGSYDRAIFDKKCDIVAIKVKDGVPVECKVAGIVAHSPKKIKRLDKRFYKKNRKDPIIVTKAGSSSNETSGCIENISCELLCDDNTEVLFHDAVKVKSSSAKFLEDGDSGALISFLDTNGNQQPFAYFVCKREQFFYCLNLDKALTELKLSDAGCFDKCARYN